MVNKPHIIVLGGGLIGLSCADSLVSKGARVTLLEKQLQTGAGAGRYNSAMVHPSQSAPWLFEGDKALATQLVLSLAQASKSLLQMRRLELGCCDTDRPTGSLQLFDTVADMSEALEHSKAFGIAVEVSKNVEFVDRHAVFYPDDRSGDAYHYCQLLTEDLIKRGCDILYEQNAVLDVSGGRCRGVNVRGQAIGADQVIVACGAQSRDFLNPYDIDLPVLPMRGHALSFSRPKSISLPNVPIMHWDSRSALTVFKNEIRLSGTVDEDTPDALLKIWRKITPDIVNALADPVVKWSADRPASLLGRPIIDQTSISNLWVNSGHSHMGWSLCAASGELMADMILDGKAAPEFALPQ